MIRSSGFMLHATLDASKKHVRRRRKNIDARGRLVTIVTGLAGPRQGQRMAETHIASFLRRLRGGALRHAGESPTDGELLELFVARRDGAAFEALVHRHGAMVLGVCRRILGHAQDAEDAFQATFLVLARKGATVRPRGRVGGWLYGVARRTALQARADNARRRAHERQVRPTAQPTPDAEAAGQELRPLLDGAVSRLPEKYREPVVLCELEGRPRREVARQLGIPEGTLSSRLAAARKRLARRLARPGAGLPSAALAALLAREAGAQVPQALASAARVPGMAGGGAVPATVVALAERVMKGMFLMKLKQLLALILLVGAVGAAGTALSALGSVEGVVPPQVHSAAQPAGEPTKQPPRRAQEVIAWGVPVAMDKGVPAPGKPEEAVRREQARLRGKWRLVAIKEVLAPDAVAEKRGGEWVAGPGLEAARRHDITGVYLTFEGDRVTVAAPPDAGRRRAYGLAQGSYVVDPSRTPKAMDLTPMDAKLPAEARRAFGAIYLLDGNELWIADFSGTAALDPAGHLARPASFDLSVGINYPLRVLVLRRVLERGGQKRDGGG
jgi:RNA polymerase sigma factor (sigma-70 family)